MAVSSSGCLVTSVPEYEAPEQTRPFMMEATASPPTWQILEFTHKDISATYEEKSFSVQVISEDLGAEVKARFYLVRRGVTGRDDDYFGGEIPAASLDTADREPLEIDWAPDNAERGCYTLFWVAAHAFDQSPLGDCPVTVTDPTTNEQRNDSSRISWTVIVCDEKTPCSDEVLPQCDDGEPEFDCDPLVGGGP